MSHRSITSHVRHPNSELTSRCHILIAFWHNASKALYQCNMEPVRERAMFSELLSENNIENSRFKLFLVILAHFNPQRFNRYDGIKDVCDRVYRHRARPMPELNSTQTEHLWSLEQQRFGHKWGHGSDRAGSVCVECPIRNMRTHLDQGALF